MKLKLSYIIILFSAITTYGQVFLSAETNVKESSVNDVVSLTIVMEISGEDYVQESRLKLPDLEKFEILANGSDQKTFIDPVNKVRVNQFVFQLLLQPKQAGNVKIGSALVKVNGKMYKSESFDILVRPELAKKSQDKAAYSNDIYLNVKLEDHDTYKNEPVVAVLRAYSRDIDNFRKIKNIQAKKQSNVLVHAINYTRSDIEPGAKQDYASQIIGVFVVFPKEEGEIEIPSFTAEVGDSKMSKLVSNRPVMTVRKLPVGAPDDFDGLVGHFSINITDSESLPQPIEINKPLEIVLKMTGKGNLSPLKMPKIIETEDYSVFPPKFVKNIKTDKHGFVGDIQAHYMIVPKKSGNIAIKSESLSFFDPSIKAYNEVDAQTIVVNAMTPDEISNSKTTLQKVNEYTNNVLETVSTPVIQTKNLKISTDKKINWGIIAGNLALVGVLSYLFLFFRRRSLSKSQNLAKLSNVEPSRIVNVSETEAILREKYALDITAHLQYLENLLNQQNYTAFFKGFSELNEEVKIYISKKHKIDFSHYLLLNFGQSQSENYQRLLQSIEIEKYAPIHSDDEMKELMKLINSVFLNVES